METSSYEILNSVISKMDELRQIEKEHENNFNILSILGKEYNEVIMCKILWAILDRKVNGKRIHLESFIQEILKIDLDTYNNEKCTIYREYCIPQNNRRIDLVVRTSNHFIPIEAKIYADDQDNQCADYLAYAENYYKNPNEAVLFYLTLNRRNPSSYSYSRNPELLRRIKLISWQDILEWMESQKDLCKSDEEVIGQFCKALKLILNKKEGEFMMSIDELINSPDGIRASIEIENALNRKKIALLHTIFEEIIARTGEEEKLNYDPILNNPWDYKKAIEEYYFHRLASSTYPAITYNLGQIEKDQNGNEYYLIIRFEICWKAYIGYAIMKRDKEGNLFTENYPSSQLIELAKSLLVDSSQFQQKKGDWWLYWEYITSSNQDVTENEPDFRQLNEAYLLLYNEQNRRDFVDKVMEMLKKFVNNAK